ATNQLLPDGSARVAVRVFRCTFCAPCDSFVAPSGLACGLGLQPTSEAAWGDEGCGSAALGTLRGSTRWVWRRLLGFLVPGARKHDQATEDPINQQHHPERLQPKVAAEPVTLGIMPQVETGYQRTRHGKPRRLARWRRRPAAWGTGRGSVWR